MTPGLQDIRQWIHTVTKKQLKSLRKMQARDCEGLWKYKKGEKQWRDWDPRWRLEHRSRQHELYDSKTLLRLWSHTRQK
jgi:hypothetical protein